MPIGSPSLLSTMKQIIQNYRTGELEVAEVPVPLCSSNTILVRNVNSLISLGTERSLIELGQKSLLGKARARPDLVKRFMDKAKKEGFVKTFKEALGRLDNPTSLGYSSAGVLIEAGQNVHRFSPGDRVACIGAGYASHAEYITVPENLCCKIPDNLSFEEASFGMLGIIALHGVRCSKLTFGESVAVIGLGLLGILTVQILKSYGCKVIGVDVDPYKAQVAQQLGADLVFSSDEDFRNGVERATGGYGADAVIITAATKSDVPVNTAVEIARQGGRIVLVGVADIHPQRNEMWHKEVEIIVSKAGGPGIFDPFYENKGIDYPIGYVRWTENRNLDEFLSLISVGKVDVKSLISHRFRIEQAEAVYKDMLENKGGPYIGVVLKYPDEPLTTGGNKSLERKFYTKTKQESNGKVSVGVIGAGLFGKALLLPALKEIKGVKLHTLSTSSGANAYHTAKKYGFEFCATDDKEIIENKEIDASIILTPHRLHASMVIESLNAGKHVFVEKPLCINEEELREIMRTYSALIADHSSLFLLVGYNRRFSAHTVKAKEFLEGRQDPLLINYRVNAGYVPPGHWVHSEEEGGSRIIGEICHFVDVMQFLTKSNPVRVYGERISGNNRTAVNSDNVAITVKFEDGSVGNIFYTASGDKAYSREQVEIFCEGKTIVIKDYKETTLHRDGKSKSFKTMNQEMGYKEELQHFLDVIAGTSDAKLTVNDIFISTMTVFKMNEALDRGVPVRIAL
ncbi:MAG: bi-domain-containing oxidoreductase [Nitrospirae bacterium]|nr:bi-domain-containing oxidoreductase [Nitrospirota bacterium]